MVLKALLFPSRWESITRWRGAIEMRCFLRASGNRTQFNPIGSAYGLDLLGHCSHVEIVWALSLKWAAMKGGWLASSLPIVLSFVNMGALALALRGLPAGTAYAVWTGLGAVGVSLFGALMFDEKLYPPQLFFLAVIIVGIVGTNYFGHSS